MLTHTKFKLSEKKKQTARGGMLRRFAGASALFAVGTLCLGGCGGSDDEPRNTSSRSNSLSSLFLSTVSIRDTKNPAAAYECWVATRPSARDEGFALISPDEVPPGRGMIVVYPDNRFIAFAGRETFVDLQVVYAEGVGEGVGRITDIGSIGAFSTNPVAPSKPVKYVLFVRNGDLARSEAKVGDLIYVPVVTPSR